MTTIPDLGLKHTCSSCATRFYDLGKRPAACPKCNHRVAVVIAPIRRKRRVSGDSANAAQQMVIIANPKPKPVKWKKRFSG